MPTENRSSLSRAVPRAPKQLALKRVGLALLFFFAASAARGQITVPAESKEHTPIPVTLTAMVPEGAQIKSGAGLVWPEGVNKLEVGTGQWVVCAPPGEYTITYRVSWLHIQPVTFIDGSGKEITIQSYLGSGDIDEKATFKVLGGSPPVPPPPPPPPGSKWGLILRETNNGQSPALGNLLISLRLKYQDNKLVIHDPTTLPDRLRSILTTSVTPPALVVLARQTDGTDLVAKVVPLSATTTVADVDKELR